ADSDLLINLKRALRDLGDPFLPLVVVPRELRLLIVSAKIRIDPDQRWEPVATRVRDALLDAFGFERMELARGVASSRVLSVMQAVRGVSWVDLDAFGAIDTMVTPTTGARRLLTPAELSAAVAKVVATVATDGVAPAVQSQRARRDSRTALILPAQLVLLSPDAPETLVLNQLK
ncbi:MAG TPA: hypothetical protein VLJ62_32190, partial [Burkholderiaceae bacterium]|nr:hypothetical protein [Burkholderiaceae bacterium]